MKIASSRPPGRALRNGNRHTALRWAAFLRAAGHRVAVSTEDRLPTRPTSCSPCTPGAAMPLDQAGFRRPSGRGPDRNRRLSRYPRVRGGARVARARRPPDRAAAEGGARSCPRASAARCAWWCRAPSTAPAPRIRSQETIPPLRHRPSARGEGSAADARCACAHSRPRSRSRADRRAARSRSSSPRPRTRATAGSAACRTRARCGGSPRAMRW